MQLLQKSNGQCRLEQPANPYGICNSSRWLDTCDGQLEARYRFTPSTHIEPPMKTLALHPIVLGSMALAIGTLLPSCVDPYVQNHGPSHSVTTYHVGYEVSNLPPGYRTEVIGGTNYYNYNGTYYRPRSGRYVVVDAPRPRYESSRPRYDRQEVIITKLPRGYRPVEHRGVRYYQVNDTYYQKRGAGYIIVGRPY